MAPDEYPVSLCMWESREVHSCLWVLQVPFHYYIPSNGMPEGLYPFDMLSQISVGMMGAPTRTQSPPALSTFGLGTWTGWDCDERMKAHLPHP